MGSLSTPESVQKLQTALHAKAKAEAGYRFYALYDKIYREDILAHAYAQCRSNRGAPGVAFRSIFCAIQIELLPLMKPITSATEFSAGSRPTCGRDRASNVPPRSGIPADAIRGDSSPTLIQQRD